MAKTGFAYHPIYMEHFAGVGHPERPERLTAILKALEGSGLMDSLVRLTPSACPREYVEAVHTTRLVESVERLCGIAPQHIDPDTAVSEKSFEAALRFAPSGRPAIMRKPTAQWAFASLTTSQSRRAICSVCEESEKSS